MLRVKEGDLSAYETLIDKFKQPVMNLVYRLIHDLDEAEDIAQNVFIQIWKTQTLALWTKHTYNLLKIIPANTSIVHLPPTIPNYCNRYMDSNIHRYP